MTIPQQFSNSWRILKNLLTIRRKLLIHKLTTRLSTVELDTAIKFFTNGHTSCVPISIKQNKYPTYQHKCSILNKSELTWKFTMVFPFKNNPEKKLNYYGRIPNCVIGVLGMPICTQKKSDSCRVELYVELRN
jgi:hypothetical protein